MPPTSSPSQASVAGVPDTVHCGVGAAGGADALDPRNSEVRSAQAEAVERVAFDLDAQQLLAVRHRAQRPGCSALGPSRVGAAAENDRAEERHERADPEPHRIKLQERASVPWGNAR